MIIAAIMPIQDEYRVDFFLWDLSLSLSHTYLYVSGLGETAHYQPAHVEDRETEGALIPGVRL